MSIVNSHNEWDKLEEIIVGDGFPSTLPALELSFQLFFHNNIHGQSYDERIFNKESPIKKQYVEEMNEDVEEFVQILKDFGTKVRRPKVPKKIEEVKTPHWKSTNFNSLMTRDLVLIVGDMIIETPVSVRYRMFETDYMKHLFMEYFKSGARWISAPRPLILDESFDFSYALKSNWDEGAKEFYEKLKSQEKSDLGYGYEMMFDAANCMRFGRDIVMNAVTENQRLGVQWLQRVLGDEYKLWTIEMVDSHIDSTVVPLKPGLLLTTWKTPEKEMGLPEPLRKWDIVEAPMPEDPEAEYDYDGSELLLASAAIDTNVLSLDQNTVVCHNVNYKHLQPLLKPYNIECIPCRMRHSRIFGGAFHCLTLDIRRQSKLERYF